MTVSESLRSYEDCLAVLDAAIADPKGLRLSFEVLSTARHFRLRCHYARKLDRQRNARVYPKEDIRHGTSHYDQLVLRLRSAPPTHWLYFEKITSLPGRVESLSGAEVNLYLPSAEPMKMIAAPELRPPEAVDLGEAFDKITPVDGEVIAPTPKVRRI